MRAIAIFFDEEKYEVTLKSSEYFSNEDPSTRLDILKDAFVLLQKMHDDELQKMYGDEQ
jgi:hypothetical protein